MLSEESFKVLCLNLVGDIGPKRFEGLVSRFGSVGEIFKAGSGEIGAVCGITPRAASEILDPGLSRLAEKEALLAEKMGVDIITCLDARFPAGLSEIPGRPLLVYVKGGLECLQKPCLAIVGSRRPTTYGLDVADNFSSDFASSGVTVVSGLARGIDSQAHKSALKAGGATVAVLGNGLNFHYPPENRKLEAEIQQDGALISEFPLNARPDKTNFPRRNRIISALSAATVVVEADIKSGALITARFAAEQCKDVFAVPGNIFSKYSKGTHYLIKSGAALVESAGEVLEALNIEAAESSKAVESMDESDKAVADLVSASPAAVSIDFMSGKLKLPYSKIFKSLVFLELKGFIRSLPGKLYTKKN